MQIDGFSMLKTVSLAICKVIFMYGIMTEEFVIRKIRIGEAAIQIHG